MRPAASSARRRRVAFYAHDTVGLGHSRRNTKVAAALVTEHPTTDVLLLTGAPEATLLPLPPATEVLTLPTLRKHADGHYAPRVLSGTLDDLLRMRSALIETALAAFEPDLFVVDKVPRGVRGELDPALRTLRHLGSRVVLGLRDVLDEPQVARREWERQGATAAVRAWYDAVWVYGDPRVCDPAHEYGWPADIAEMVAYTGYLAGPEPDCLQVRHRLLAAPRPPDGPFVLCLVGGGEDGHALAHAFVRARLPDGHHGVVLTGPHMAAGQRRQLRAEAGRRQDITVHEFAAGATEFVQHARAAVSMGGYNSVCELLGARCPALLVPRTSPRAEQAVRADRLARAGWVDALPAAVAGPGRIGAWLASAVGASPRRRRPLDLDGLAHIPPLADHLLDTPEPAEVPDVAV